MAQVTNTFSTNAAIGNREDLIDKILNIDPVDCPLQVAIGKSKAEAKYHEWQTDSLATANADNAQIEGDEYTYDAVTPTVRVGNYTQIFRKSVIVSGTQEKTTSAGRKSEFGYQIAKRNDEIKRDLEASITSNNASVAGNDTTPKKSAGFRAWLETNTDLGVGGADGGFASGIVAAATDGTQRAFTRTLLDDVIQSTYEAGGKPKKIFLSPKQKRVFSGFMADADVAQLRSNVTGNGKTTIIAGVDMYKSDFGDISVEVDLFMRDREALLIDPEYASIADLRKMQVDKPAKTGDAEKWVVLSECTLRVDNEGAHGVVADLS